MKQIFAALTVHLKKKFCCLSQFSFLGSWLNELISTFFINKLVKTVSPIGVRHKEPE